MEEKQGSNPHAQSSARTHDIDEQLTTSCRHYFDQTIVFKPASKPDSYRERLNSNYRPLNPMPEWNTSPTRPGKEDAKPQTSQDGRESATKDGIPSPKRVLYNPAQLEMKWLSQRGVGSGLSNMGNTCFLNSVLQCLTYTPPLYNYLVSDHHKRICKDYITYMYMYTSIYKYAVLIIVLDISVIHCYIYTCTCIATCTCMYISAWCECYRMLLSSINVY